MGISKFVMKLFGWGFEGLDHLPVKKAVVIALPHTSNWDFPLGLLTRNVMDMDVKFIGKHSLFKPPLGWLFRALGGYPVDRTMNNKLVDAVVDIFDSKENFSITIAPEGTRKKVKRLRTGFYQIARKANVPIIIVAMDWGSKTIKFSPPFLASDKIQDDLDHIKEFLSNVSGRHKADGWS